jgi:hypothetical protein
LLFCSSGTLEQTTEGAEMRRVSYEGNPEWTNGGRRLSVTLDDDAYALLEALAYVYSLPITDVARKLLEIGEHSDWVDNALNR